MRAIALTALLLASPCAAADKAAPAVLSAGGFLGRWAVDCARLVSVDNRGVVVALNSTATCWWILQTVRFKAAIASSAPRLAAAAATTWN